MATSSREANLTFLRRVSNDEGVEVWSARKPDCPAASHRHILSIPWPEGRGTVNLQTQAGFTLGGMEKLAVHWDKPWFLTVVD